MKLQRCRALLALSLALPCVANAAAWSKAFAVEWFEPAFYYGAKEGADAPGTDCPEGTNPENDWRKNDRRFREPDLSRALNVVDKLRAIGEKLGHTPGEVAIAWALAHPAVTGAIVGGRNTKQVEETVRAVDLKLGFDDMGVLNAL